MAEQQLYCNGIQAETGTYLVEPMTVPELAAAIRGERYEAPEPRGLRADLDAQDLGQAGWGVVFGPEVTEQVREALTPLLELRRQQAGELFRDDLVYHGGTWEQLLQDNDAGPFQVDPAKVPYYLLLVGDGKEIPFELQSLLAVQYAVGRLAFATPDEYAHYAEGVLAVEQGQVTRPRRLDIFGVLNDDDPATAASVRHLVEPLVDAVTGYGGWQTASWLREEAHKSRLSQLIGEGPDEAPALLFTAGHAVGFYPHDPAQMTDQGGLLCSDWSGPRAWAGRRIPPELYLAARDVATDADVRGLISCHFACYSAGTPRLDAFSRTSGAAIRSIAPHDLVAALPRRLLGHPRG